MRPSRYHGRSLLSLVKDQLITQLIVFLEKMNLAKLYLEIYSKHFGL